jgi:hypothetical protein
MRVAAQLSLQKAFIHIFSYSFVIFSKNFSEHGNVWTILAKVRQNIIILAKFHTFAQMEKGLFLQTLTLSVQFYRLMRGRGDDSGDLGRHNASMVKVRQNFFQHS